MTIRDHTFEGMSKTGQFRGWLCGACNQGLGEFRDSEQLLQAAIDYMRRSANPR